MELIWNDIVSKTRQFVSQAGFSKVVIGLSGGIDSAVVACIATQALGKENLLAVMMSSPYSSKGSIDDSMLLAKNWGFETAQIPISTLMGSFDLSLKPFFQGTARDITEENLQARIRAVILMALSNKQNRLLLNTCNKSEDYVGYCTLYGDSCGAVAPMGDLYKTEVRALANWINANPKLPNIPISIITKEPSAELSENQRDTDSLPPYDILDSILSMLVDENISASDVISRGYDKETVNRVVALKKGSEFKRIQAPPSIKVERDLSRAINQAVGTHGDLS